MYPDLGKIKPGTTLFVPFHTFSSDDPSASMTITGLLTSDIEVYKDASMTQRASDAGYALVDTDGIDIDTTTGFHGVTINLSNNTTAGFWSAGSDYVVVVSSITLDGATINFIAARFSIGYDGAFLETTLATLASQTGFTLTAGPADDDALNNCPVIIHDVASGIQIAHGYISDYTGSSKTVTLSADPGIFTMAAGDNISIFPPSTVGAIAGSKDAADKAGDQFNGTGITGDTFPATQSQLSGIANVGASTNKPSASYTLTSGVQSSGTFASTAALDGTNHEHTDAAGVMDLYYEFSIGSGIPISVTMTGYLTGNNDDLEVYGYDWVATAWVQIGTMAGKVASTNEVNSYDMFVNMVGTGANKGTVRVRFTDGAFTLTTATLAIDQIFLSFASGSSGYDNGSLWLDTNASNTNTVVGVDGTADNPVSTIAAIVTLSASTGLTTVTVAPGSSFTMASSFDNYTFQGASWTLALGGQSISGTVIDGADVTGIATGANRPHFLNCSLGAVTLPPSKFGFCGIGASAGTFTAGSAGQFLFHDCYSVVAGSGSPAFVFTGLGSTTGINNRRWAGGSSYTLDSDCTLSHEVLAGGTTTITAGGADTEVRGIFKALTYVFSGAGANRFVGVTGVVTVSGTTTATLSLCGIYGTVTDTSITAVVTLVGMRSQDIGLILGDTAELQTDWADGGRLDLIQDDILLDTNNLQINQGNWLTATGFAEQSVMSVVLSNVVGLSGALMRGTDSAPTASEIDTEFTTQHGAGAWATATGFSTHSAADVWASATRTLTSFGTLVADIWASVARTLTANTNFNDPSATTIATAVWANATRTLSSFGTLLADIWTYVTRTLTAGTNLNDISTAQVAAELETYDGLKRVEATADKAEIISYVDDLAIKKNVAFSNFQFLMVLATDGSTPATGLTVTAQMRIDSAAFINVTGTITEVSNGLYNFDALAADTNGDVITWRFSEATAKDTFFTFKTVS